MAKLIKLEAFAILLASFLFLSTGANAAAAKIHTERSICSDGTETLCDYKNDCKTYEVVRKGNTCIITIFGPEEKKERTFKSKSEFSKSDQTKYSRAWNEFNRNLKSEKIAIAEQTAKYVEVLKQNNPDGAEIYARVKNKNIFSYFTKDSRGRSLVDLLDTGVHESLHHLDGELRSYYLIGGDTVRMPRSSNTYPRSLANKEIPKDIDLMLAGYRDTYLVDSGNQSLDILLDELNAYAHGANTTIELSDKLESKNPINPGLQAMMYFVEMFLKHGRLKLNTQWSKLQKNDDYQQAIVKLWDQAELTLIKACESNHSSSETEILARVYQMENLNELKEYLGPKFQSREKEIRKACGLDDTSENFEQTETIKENNSALTHLKSLDNSENQSRSIFPETGRLAE